MVTVFSLAAVLIFLYVRYRLQRGSKRPLHDEELTKWKSSRMKVIATLRHSAFRLKNSYRQKAEAEQSSAKKSVVGDILGLGGVLLAPFSGGLSLAATGASALTAVNSFLSKRAAIKRHDELAEEIIREIKRAEGQDRAATIQLNKMLSTLDSLQEQFSTMKIDDIIMSVKESISTLPTSDWTQTKGKTGWAGSKTDNEVRHFHRKDKFPVLSNAKQVGTVIKTVKFTRHVSNTTKHVSKAAKFETSLLTPNAVRLNKLSHAATKAVNTVSKVGLVVSAISIPLGMFNLMKTTDDLDKLHVEVTEIEDRADRLKEELENVSNVLLLRCKYTEDLHRQLYRLYQDHQIEEVFEYLLLMYEKLGLDIPVPY